MSNQISALKAPENTRDAAGTAHPLTPLLAPQSVALIGASTQVDAAGNDMVLELLDGGFQGTAYAVNPKYDEIEGIHCYPSLSALPEVVDLAVIAVGNARIEAVLDEAIELGVGAAVIFGSAYLDGDAQLSERIRAKARAAGMPICGANCMGFYNMDQGLRAFPQHIARDFRPGGVTYISQSGSVLTGLLWNDQKLRFNLAVSAGMELVTTAADYMDYALEQPSTRVIALFLEAVRDPAAFVAALEKARQKEIPVVVLKAGRSEAAAALAVSHSGAIAGDDAAYQALFERYGVIRVKSLDELAATSLLLSQPRRMAAGGIAAIGDSGGEREVLMDLADEAQVPFAAINDDTVASLKENLDPGLEPINPLDAWGTGNNYQQIFEHCWQALMDDPDTAMGVFMADLTSRFWLHESFARVCRRVSMRSTKPVVMLTNHVGTDSQDLAMRLCRAGIPVLDGTEQGLSAIRHAMDYRDFLKKPEDNLPQAVSLEISLKWRARLSQPQMLDEFEGLQLLQDYGVPTQAALLAASLEDALQAAEQIGYPLVLKTAMPGILHKSDVGGVKLNLQDSAQLTEAYQDLDTRLGSRVLLAGMAQGTAEVAFGVLNDPQFGPMVMIAGGGIFIEVLRDRQIALAPVGQRDAREMIDKLAMRPLLDGLRGQEACDVDALTQALSRLSLLASDLGDLIAEMDVNPVKVSADGCVAVDALVVPKAALESALQEAH